MTVPTVETTTFAELPRKYWITDQVNAWLAFQFRGKPMASLLEGPDFDRDGNLYIVDIPWGRIFKISPAGDVDLFLQYDGHPQSLKLHNDGRIFVTDYVRGLLTVDPGTAQIESLLTGPSLEPFVGLVDLTFASNGDLYFTDKGASALNDPTGRLYRLTADGRLDLLLDNMPGPNGLVMNPAETELLVAVTQSNSIWRVPISQTGQVRKASLFIQLSGGIGPDGLACDEAGNLAVAHPGRAVVWLFNEAGELITQIKTTSGRHPTNIAYGGNDGRTLYITEFDSNSVLTARLDVPGKVMYGIQ